MLALRHSRWKFHRDVAERLDLAWNNNAGEYTQPLTVTREGFWILPFAIDVAKQSLDPAFVIVGGKHDAVWCKTLNANSFEVVWTKDWETGVHGACLFFVFKRRLMGMGTHDFTTMQAFINTSGYLLDQVSASGSGWDQIVPCPYRCAVCARPMTQESVGTTLASKISMQLAQVQGYGKTQQPTSQRRSTQTKADSRRLMPAPGCS